jgi:hypothetical protein
MITKEQWLKAKPGTSFYWIDDWVDEGMVKWIYVKKNNKGVMSLFGWDDRRFLNDNVGDVWKLSYTLLSNLKQVEPETQKLIYDLEN